MSDKFDRKSAAAQAAPAPAPSVTSSLVRINKTELVWPGKYDEQGRRREAPRVNLPFQVIERVNESRATRESRQAPQQGLFEMFDSKEGSSFDQGWRNKLIWGDNLLVMGSLMERFAGKIDLIYIDPPFATGADFSFTVDVGDEGTELFKEQSLIEEKAYRDTWGSGLTSYLQMMYVRISLMKDLLAANGCFFLHCDWHVGHALKAICDEVFGPDRFINEIAWCYTGPGSPGARQFSRKHDTIFWYANGDKWTFNADATRVAHHDKTRSNFKAGLKGSGFIADTYDLAEGGKIPEDYWNIAVAARFPVDGVRRTGYATEKPWPLLERIILAASNEGDLVADFFAGSGTTMAVAETLGRRWIGCDLGRYAIHVTRKRLLGIEGTKPLELVNLGRYERQYWQDVTFDRRTKGAPEQALFQYLAFILKLYGAQPVPGLTHLHGKRGTAFVHVGAVDAPVTITEVAAALDECVALKQKELHVLGWEWEMGMVGPEDGGLIQRIAKDKRIKLSLLQIPREVMEQQAAGKGDVKFFELAYLEIEIQQRKTLTAGVKLKDFVIPPDTEWIPADVRAKIRKWSDYIDYWAVDWDFKDDTFVQGWVTYRTRRDRSLAVESDTHQYEAPGRYTILVKVVDIFGNDTSQARDVNVR